MKSSDVVRALAPDDQTADEEPLTATLFPLRFLGMGLLIAWLCCTHVVSIFPGVSFETSLRTLFDSGMRVGDIGTFVVFALLAPRIGRLSSHKVLLWCAVLLTSCGTGLVGFFLLPSGTSEDIMNVVSVVTGVGGAFLFCLWAEVYCQMGTTRTLMYGALSCVTAAVVSFLISALEQPYGVAATALLPVASLACAILSFRLLPTERAATRDVRYPIPWKLIMIMAIVGLLSSFSDTFLAPTEYVGAFHRIWATATVGIAILVMALAWQNRFDARLLVKVGLPISILAFAIIPFAAPDWGFVVSVLMRFAYVWFTFFVLLMLANISYRFEVPSLRMFAIARASSEGALFIGLLARRALIEAHVLDTLLALIGFALGGIVLILVCVVIWMSEKTVNSDWGASGISLSDKLHVPGPRERFMARCDAIAAQYGLTPREQEIMALVAQRKSRAEIEQELFLSQNTVKTHVRHLYAKLGVGSKADVIELLEA